MGTSPEPDGYERPGWGSRSWAVQYGPLRRSPFWRAAGEENFGHKCHFNEILSGFCVIEPWSPNPLSWGVDLYVLGAVGRYERSTLRLTLPG